jgi:paraquat-inducible protein B
MAEVPELENLPRAAVVPRRPVSISLIWVIPIVTAVVAVGIAVQRLLSDGPTITITFKAAEGLEAGKTFVKYKDVNIGQVTKVELSEDYRRVVVTAKIAKSAQGLMVEDATFWVVEPRISLSGISGLGTLLSGNYIGFDAGRSTKSRRAFTGLDDQPIVTRSQPGRQFVLKADNLGSLGVGSPLYFRRLAVGEVLAYELAEDGRSVQIKVFVNAPYDRYVTPETRFWNASGVDVSVGANGLNVQTESVVALLMGGVAFDTPPSAAAAEPAGANTVFTLHGNRAKAFAVSETLAEHYVLEFDESLRGLSLGAPVTLFGLPVGEVTDIGLVFDPKTLNVRTRVWVVYYPRRALAQFHDVPDPAQADRLRKTHEVLQRMIDRGLRAQLRSGSLITGQLYVAFDYFPHAQPVKVDWGRQPVQLPITPSGLTDIEAKVTSVLDKLDRLPYDKIGKEITDTLATLDRAVKDADKLIKDIDAQTVPELNSTLKGLRGTLAHADSVLKNADATLLSPDAPAQQELRNAMQEVTRAARSIRVLADYLERHPEALIRGKTKEVSR